MDDLTIVKDANGSEIKYEAQDLWRCIKVTRVGISSEEIGA